jgi:VWFA-related protein
MKFMSRKLKILAPILLLAPLSIIGCGGGSGEGGTSGAAITVSPAGFDFGLVTEGNLDEVAPRQFVISNTGTDSYNVSNIRLVNDDPDEFDLDERDGADPCNARAFSLAPGDSCTITVRFAPAPTNFGSFRAALLVQTNDPNADSIARSLAGTYARIESINVTVNQINACPRPQQAAKVFVSVTDQGGFPVRGLTLANFALREGGSTLSVADARSVANSNTDLALSIVMDYSSSITNFPSAVDSMEQGAKLLVDRMQATDEAEIIKYADTVKFMLPGGFTSDKAVLQAAIAQDPEFVSGTAFYDATVAAVDRISTWNKDRKVVISLTDGEDTRSTGNLAQAIANALNTDVPVFTVGFGNVDAVELQTLASGTGGLFYNPAAAANLEQVYQRLANLLFEDQYVLTYVTNLQDGDTPVLEVTADFFKDNTRFQGQGSKTILVCP